MAKSKETELSYLAWKFNKKKKKLSVGNGISVRAEEEDVIEGITIALFGGKKPTEKDSDFAREYNGRHFVGTTESLGKNTHVLVYPMAVDYRSEPGKGKSLYSGVLFSKTEPNIDAPTYSVYATDIDDAADQTVKLMSNKNTKTKILSRYKQDDPKQGYKHFKIKENKTVLTLRMWNDDIPAEKKKKTSKKKTPKKQAKKKTAKKPAKKKTGKKKQPKKKSKSKR